MSSGREAGLSSGIAAFCHWPPPATPGKSRRPSRQRRWLRFASLLGALVLGAGLAAWPQSAAPAGASPGKQPAAVTVVAVEVQPPPAHQTSEYLPLIVQPAGSALDSGLVRQSIENLFSTGDFASVQAVEYTAPGGVRLVFQTTPNYFLSYVAVVNAPNPPSDSELEDASGLTLGQLYDPASASEAIAAIQQRLQTYGYYKTTLHPDIKLDRDRATARVYIDVDVGPLVRVGKVVFSGNTVFPAAVLLRESGLAAGKPLARSRLEKALADLQKFYGANNRLTATVLLARQTYHAANNTVDLDFHIDPGPIVSVRVTGPANVGKVLSTRFLGFTIPFLGMEHTLRQQIPIYEEDAVDAELLEEGRSNLREYLQGKGYFEAKVTYTRTDTAPGRVLITYNIVPGIKEDLETIRFEGNQYFDNTELRDHIAIRPTSDFLPDLIPGARGKFGDQLVQADAAAIQDLYRANGFTQATATSEVVHDYEGKPDQVAVTFKVNEGPQVLVRKLTITGNETVKTAALERLLATMPNEPYSSENIAKDRDSILSYYFDAGYNQAEMDVRLSPIKGQNLMDVTYDIAEGPQERVNSVYISGERFVRTKIIRQNVSLQPGEPLSQTAMLDTQRSLYSLGLFTDVNVTPNDPSGNEPEKDVVIGVHEAHRYAFNEIAGLQVQGGTGGNQATNPLGSVGVSPLVGFDVTRLAMTGRDQTLSFKTRYGTLQKRALADYSMRRFLNRPNWTADFNTGYDDTNDVLTFRAIRETASGQLEQQISRTTHYVYRLEYRHIRAIINTAGEACTNPTNPICAAAFQGIPLLANPDDIGMADVSWVNDHRDDPLDSHHGTYDTVEGGLARSFGNGYTPYFWRSFGENSSYYSFGSKQQYVLARSTRLGFELPFGPPPLVRQTDAATGKTVLVSERVVPLPERYFSGGPDTLRGFDINQAGPRDPITGFPVGGNALFINNVEFRYPLIGSNIGGVVFYDAGNVYTALPDVIHSLFRVKAPSTTDPNFTSHDVGSGIRYKTPVGPVRLDLAWLLNPPTYQTCNLVGNKCLPSEIVLHPPGHPTGLAHLHFWFSIGQTF
jgi:outer membrane protein insertion porin family